VTSGSLERLVDTARALPGERRPVLPLTLALVEADLDGAAVDVGALRGRLGRLLQVLADRLGPALTDALQHAAVAWDAFDAVAVMDPALHRDATWIATAAAALEREADPARRAIGMEVRIALTSALGLIDLLERRLAMLVRLRVQSGDSTLLPGERPFLDVAAALAEAARGWT
jgi:hypothetical protein